MFLETRKTVLMGRSSALMRILSNDDAIFIASHLRTRHRLCWSFSTHAETVVRRDNDDNDNDRNDQVTCSLSAHLGGPKLHLCKLARPLSWRRDTRRSENAKRDVEENTSWAQPCSVNALGQLRAYSQCKDQEVENNHLVEPKRQPGDMFSTRRGMSSMKRARRAQ